MPSQPTATAAIVSPFGAPAGSWKRRRTRASSMSSTAMQAWPVTTRSAPSPFADGVEQDRLQVGAVDRQLRRVVAGPASGRLAVDVLAEAVEERRLARHDGDALEVGEDAERFERRARVRQDVDADAERPDLGGRFVDPAGDARAVQCQRERQAADAGADDGDLVASARCAKLGHDRAGAYGAAKISPQREALLVPCAS
jgi:hypothetical protein